MLLAEELLCRLQRDPPAVVARALVEEDVIVRPVGVAGSACAVKRAQVEERRARTAVVSSGDRSVVDVPDQEVIDVDGDCAGRRERAIGHVIGERVVLVLITHTGQEREAAVGADRGRSAAGRGIGFGNRGQGVRECRVLVGVVVREDIPGKDDVRPAPGSTDDGQGVADRAAVRVSGRDRRVVDVVDRDRELLVEREVRRAVVGRPDADRVGRLGLVIEADRRLQVAARNRERAVVGEGPAAAARVLEGEAVRLARVRIGRGQRADRRRDRLVLVGRTVRQGDVAGRLVDVVHRDRELLLEEK